MSPNQCCAWVFSGTRELDLWAKILKNRNRQKIHASTRTGPKTAQISKTVLKPDPQLPDDLSQL